VIYEASSPKQRQVLDTRISENMRRMLQLVVDSGTANSIRSVYGIRAAVGGKTGTTQNNADGWFIAITPNLVCGAWVGAESPLVRFRSTRLGQGAATALPIVGEFLKNAERQANTLSSVGARFPSVSASTRLDLYCPIYVENRTDHFLNRLFDAEAREEKKALKEKAREEQKDDKKGWMRRLLDKLKKKK
jgi:penicillin-binding protein 1A